MAVASAFSSFAVLSARRFRAVVLSGKVVKPLSFYPGPSKVYPQVESYLREAFESGILEQNHRSGPFMELLKDTVLILRKKLAIPDDYDIFFTSSSTECWEITAQSLMKGRVQFLYNGAFGKKWFRYAVCNPQIHPSDGSAGLEIRGSRFFEDQEAREVDVDPKNDVLCFTDSETSNGTRISAENLEELRRRCPGALLMVDATSSMGGVAHRYDLADVWFASSQKCFGLPSGLGVLVVSPAAKNKARAINERNHYNSFLNILENAEKFQTHYTPNILNIFLLNRVMHQVDDIAAVHRRLTDRATDFYRFIEEQTAFLPLVGNPLTRSETVFAIKTGQEVLPALKARAAAYNIMLGNGYGEWKDSTFRIANFPALTDDDFEKLKAVLTR